MDPIVNIHEDLLTKVQALKKCLNNCYDGTLDRKKPNSYLFFDVKKLIVDDVKRILKAFDQLDINQMIRKEKILFELAYQTALNLKSEVSAHFFEMRKNDNQDLITDITEFHYPTASKLALRYQDFYNFVQKLRKLQEFHIDDFHHYLETDEGLSAFARGNFNREEITFKLFLELTETIVREVLKFEIRDQLVVLSVVNYFTVV